MNRTPCLKILIAVSALALSMDEAKAQKFRPSILAENAIGIVGGYHLKKGTDFVELGISRSRCTHGFFMAYAFSTEFGKISNNQTLYGLSASVWFNTIISAGIATTYYSDFKSSRCFSIRPMLGIGVWGVQIAYERNYTVLKPNFDFGGTQSIALRINLGLLELGSKSSRSVERGPKW